jgi:HD superfamily phosphohydrolase
MTPKKKHELLCPDTFPENTELSFRLSSGPITIKRVAIENIPIEISGDVALRMERVSQIGLKNAYLHLDPGRHVRWAHARGAFTVGSMWLISLYEGGRLPSKLKALPYPSFETAQITVGYALLLHDYGHLFFSHLLEEALRDINWVPTDHGITSLEYTVLRNRLYEKDQSEILPSIERSFRMRSISSAYSSPLDLVFSLMQGRSGIGWLQAIVNSPIDADKIDYIRRDQDVIMQHPSFPIRTRLNFGPSEGHLPWFEEFISEQYVNHAGFLCLPGRSALAAGDLWRERLFLYERFYLAPSIRAADRMALELIQQFLIRCVVSEEFGSILREPGFLRKFNRNAETSELQAALRNVRTLSDAVSTGIAGHQIDVVKVKYDIVTAVLADLSSPFGSGSDRDWECLEFMAAALQEQLPMDTSYSELLQRAWNWLTGLKDGTKKLDEFARECIIGSIEFRRTDEPAVKELFRAFQHEHCADLLVDISVVPKPLSIPFAPSSRGGESETFAGILVPKGPIERWTSRSHDLQPLTPAATRSLERPHGTVLLLSPKNISRARKLYLMDRALAVAERHALSSEGHTDA